MTFMGSSGGVAACEGMVVDNEWEGSERFGRELI